MYKKGIVKTKTSLDINQSMEGETIEQQIMRLLNDGAPIDSEKIPIYTKPSDGVVYGTNVRDDKWDKAIETNEKINANIDKIREMKIVKGKEDKDKKEPTDEGGNEPKTGEIKD